MNEFVCAMCLESYFTSWLAFSFESEGVLHGVCGVCAE